MIELVDTSPQVGVETAEYKRLLGYPRGRGLSQRARTLTRWARDWYSNNGRPWIYARQAGSLEIENGAVNIDGVSFTSARLQQTLASADAHGVVLVAVGAGHEVEEAARKAWHEGKPDEYFFLEVFGSAVVEHLTTMVGARLCAWADGERMAVLPHYSPGYAEWDISDQSRLLELITRPSRRDLPGRLDVLESGMLRPKKSLLAVFGLTRHTDRVARLSELVPCQSCSFNTCQYRRMPYRRAAAGRKTLAGPPSGVAARETRRMPPPLAQEAKYAVNPKALARWAAERLQIEPRPDGTIETRFQYEGTTCTNLGRLLTFHYHVKLGPRDEGYPIQQQRCRPAPGDEGHTHMCRYLSSADQLMADLEGEQPLLGRPLNDVLTWNPPVCTAGCYCEPGDRIHKWRLVLETIHYALAQQERQRTRGVTAAMERS